VVPDGDYKIYVEYSEDNSLGIGADGPWTSVTFTKGADDYSVTPADEAYIINMDLAYFAPYPIGVEFVEIANDNNSNGFIDPGETGDVVVDVLNYDEVDLQNVSVACSAIGTNASYVTVNTASNDIGTIGVGSSLNSAHNISADAGAPSGTEVDLQFIATDGAYSDTLVHTISIGIDYESYFTLDFEGLEDFTTDMDPWLSLDQDGKSSWSSSDCDFTGEGTAFGFMAFNPVTAGFSLASANGGDRVGMAIGPSDASAADDWLISPKLPLGSNSILSFWTLSPKTGSWGTETYNVMVSTTDSDPASFTAIASNEDAPDAWTEKIYDISAYDNQQVYLAIQLVSSDKFIFWIDDINITTSTENQFVKENSEVRIFPNPAKQIFNVECQQTVASCNVIGINGSVYVHETVDKRNFNIDISDIDNGVYFLKLTFENGTVGYHKILKAE
jgi:hypothetical protein